MKRFIFYRNFIIVISIIIIIFILIVTFQLIDNEPQRVYEIDFNGKQAEISAYASLIGSLLSFLSIAFVIYTIIYQKNESIVIEKTKVTDEKDDLKKRLQLVVNHIESFINSLEEMNKQITIYIEKEKKAPSQVHTLYFNVNKNFSRIISNDPQSIYNALKALSPNPNQDFEILFSELFKYLDFYNDLLIELKKNNKSYKKEKFKKLENLGEEILDLYNMKADLITNYKRAFPGIHHIKPWVEKVNKSIEKYYKYLEHCAKKNEQNDIDYLNETVFKEFIEGANFTIKATGPDEYGGMEIMQKLSQIRKHLYFIKSNVFVYLEDLEHYQNEYLKDESNGIVELKSINSKIANYLS
ncbi:hypothetical protein DRF59_06775 [Chryseobacterium flavum]|uniref:Phage abortive infection protein n=1 Tax=Chryseobacterium flavum TaxID=415851 RepID=A0A3D9CQU9_9FLAO|nr:hypothetical protein [Chryseobacterium flavum]REC68008.1 hypothetical protein DRF59_06775 [Chryseobacterium flavum]